MSEQNAPSGVTIEIGLESVGPRRCGGCTLCCRLLPVRSLNKAANERCTYQRTGRGCSVYRTKAMPADCGLWTCRWLTDPSTRDLRRPDRSGYVVDVMPDFVTIQDENTKPFRIGAVQVWCDPRHPDAHRDPALRVWLARLGEDEGVVAIIRYSGTEGFTLIPPAIAADGEWHEVKSGVMQDQPLDRLFNFDALYALAEPIAKKEPTDV